MWVSLPNFVFIPELFRNGVGNHGAQSECNLHSISKKTAITNSPDHVRSSGQRPENREPCYVLVRLGRICHDKITILIRQDELLREATYCSDAGSNSRFITDPWESVIDIFDYVQTIKGHSRAFRNSIRFFSL